MANYFDQFDTSGAGVAPGAAGGGNYFDQFDAPQGSAASRLAGAGAPASMPQIQALITGVGQGATANFADEIGGAVAGITRGGQRVPTTLPGALQSFTQLALELNTGQRGPATEAYEKARDALRREAKQAQEQWPATTMTGEIVGGIVTPAKLVQAPTIGGRVVRGAAVGSAYGGASGVGSGETASQRAIGGATGAALGAGIGAAAPPLVEGVVRGIAGPTGRVINTVRGLYNTEAEAGRRIAGAITRDARVGDAGLTPGEFAQNIQGGVPVSIMDMGGTTTRGLARSAANTSPEGRAALNQMIDARFETQTPRVTEWLNQTVHYPNAAAQQDAIKQAAGAANTPAYRRAMAAPGARSMWDEGFEQIAQAPEVQAAIRKANVTAANEAARQGFTPVRNPFTMNRDGRMVLRTNEDGTQVVPNLQFWDQVKKNLDKVNTRESQDWARVLRERLDELVPEYGQARAGAAHFFGARDAVEAGQNFVTQNFAMRDVRRQFSQMSATERQLFQDGFLSRFMEVLEKSGDRRNILNQIGASPAAREKLEFVLGRQRYAELEARLRIEGIMELARGSVQGNSTTARQLVELGLAGGVGGAGYMTSDPNALMYAALVYGAARGNRAIDQRVAQRVGQMLASNDPAVLTRGIAILSRNNNMMNSLRSADQALARVGSQQSGVMPQLQGPMTGRAEGEQPSP